MSLTHRIHAGGPFLALPPGADRGYAVWTHVCANDRCTSERMHLHCTPAVRVEGRIESDTEAALTLAWNGTERSLEGEAPPELEEWAEDNAEVLSERWARLRDQRTDHLYSLRPLPEWQPGEVVAYFQLFPADFTPLVRCGSERWAILDSYCPVPWCTCGMVSLQVVCGDEQVVLHGTLLDEEPEPDAALTSDRSQALWDAITTDEGLLGELRRRSRRVRQVGWWLVGETLDRARLDQCPPLAPTEAVDAHGYLRGGVIPEECIARLFAASRELEPRLVGLEELVAEVSGAGEPRRLWVRSDGVDLDLDLGEDPLAEESQWLNLQFANRGAAPMPYLRQRLAHGWPLIAGDLLPVLSRVDEGGDLQPPTLDEYTTAVAVFEALLQWLPAPPTEKPFEVSVPVGERTLRVELRLPPYPGQASATEGADLAADDPHDADDYDFVDHHHANHNHHHHDADADDFVDLDMSLLRHALVDWALTLGVDAELGQLGATMAGHLHQFAVDYTDGDSWLAPHVWRSFLEHHAPRKVMLSGDVDIDRAPEALERVARFLGEVGFIDTDTASELRKVVRRSRGTFARRMRDSSRFGLAKATFTEMLEAGVDIGDSRAVNAYLAAQNAAGPVASKGGPGAATRRPMARKEDPRERSPDRWRPGPGERVPGPKERCPCGSGRRYKKCCKPR